MATVAQKLSPIQVHLLRFFSERPINEQETQELQQLIARFYAQKADKLMETIWQEKGYDEAKMLEILEKDFNK
ncbi:MAG: hypothetical protein EAZ32_01085 [Cytophagia bacterium]|nr:MAG: hypothetical protein EAZ46_13295 [Runella sp.]TAG25254.1 MAG: hypothetical protein EAZ38_00180 [Cytophagales bacterium]TAG42462.1 MAG: hypothetical protein EAZ32_01085 [Cytophagia bacterium]TAG56691.1 MAG: hypothetical protein EAZ29_02790 [Runella slithyformis]TAG84651.1 MAG: hypothetical protein EAZ22_00350 [Cytophagales bacterium]